MSVEGPPPPQTNISLYPSPASSQSDFNGAVQAHTAHKIAHALVPGEIQLEQKTPLPDRKILSENEIPMNTVIMAHYPQDMEMGKALAQAIIKANPNVKILFEVRAGDIKGNVKKDLARKYAIPEANVEYITDTKTEDFSAKSGVSLWPRDSGVVGGKGDIYTNEKGLAYAFDVPKDLNTAAGLSVQKSPIIFTGGDMQFITRPNGEQIVIFGLDSIKSIVDQSLDLRKIDKNKKMTEGDYYTISNKVILLAIAKIMKGLSKFDIPENRIIPLGHSDDNISFGFELAKLTPQERASIDPKVLKQLQKIKDLPLPTSNLYFQNNYTGAYYKSDYHTDLTAFTPDGKNIFISDNESSKQISSVLKAYGFNVIALRNEKKQVFVNDNNSISKDLLVTNYLNMVIGLDQKGKKTVLMPTEASNPKNLTENDKKTLDTLKQTLGANVRIIPIGGKTAILGLLHDAPSRKKNWGIHCRTLVLPQTIIRSHHQQTPASS